MVEAILQFDSLSKEVYIASLKEFETYHDEETFNSVENMLSLNFHMTDDKNTFGMNPIIELYRAQHQ